MDNDLLVRIALGFVGSMAIIFNSSLAEACSKWEKAVYGVTESNNRFGRIMICIIGLLFILVAIYKY